MESHPARDGRADEFVRLLKVDGSLQQLLSVAFEDGGLLGVNRNDVDIEDWGALSERARAHPEEAAICDEDYHFPLHLMLWCDPPLHAVESVLGAYPAALLEVTGENETALSIACDLRCKREGVCNQEVVRFLARQVATRRPPRSTQSDDSINWKEVACCLGWLENVYVCLDAAKCLLKEYPEGATFDAATFRSPLKLFIEHHDNEEAQKNANWERKMNLLLMAFAHNTTDIASLAKRGIAFKPLHAFLRYIQKYSTYRLCSGVEDGYTRYSPLLSHPGVKDWIGRLRERGINDFSTRDSTGMYPISILLESQRPIEIADESSLETIFEIVLREHPSSAACSNSSGRLPLHLAIEKGWPADAICRHAPKSIRMRDPLTGLFPFQAAAASSTARINMLLYCGRVKNSQDIGLQDLERDILSSVELSYRLLKEDPSLVNIESACDVCMSEVEE